MFNLWENKYQEIFRSITRLPAHTCLNRKCRLDTLWTHPISPSCQSSVDLLRDSGERENANLSGAGADHESKPQKKEVFNHSLWWNKQVLNGRKH